MTTNTISFGGREFELKPLPWAKLRKVMALINRIGGAAATQSLDESSLDDMGTVLCLGYGLETSELDAMPATLADLQRAFEAIVKVTGIEEAMEAGLQRGARLARQAEPLVSTSASL